MIDCSSLVNHFIPFLVYKCSNFLSRTNLLLFLLPHALCFLRTISHPHLRFSFFHRYNSIFLENMIWTFFHQRCWNLVQNLILPFFPRLGSIFGENTFCPFLHHCCPFFVKRTFRPFLHARCPFHVEIMFRPFLHQCCPFLVQMTLVPAPKLFAVYWAKTMCQRQKGCALRRSTAWNFSLVHYLIFVFLLLVVSCRLCFRPRFLLSLPVSSVSSALVFRFFLGVVSTFGFLSRFNVFPPFVVIFLLPQRQLAQKRI